MRRTLEHFLYQPGGFDGRDAANHNGSVRRRLLTLLFALLAWGTLAHFGPSLVNDSTPPVMRTASDAGAASLPHGPADSDSRWVAGYRAQATGTSLWKSAAFHADLATATLPAPLAATLAVGPREHHAPDPPPHLRHTPLLI